MKYSHLLTVSLSLTSASIIPNPSVEPHENKLQLRVWGNKPGDPGYVPEDDEDWHRNGGTERSGDLWDDHLAALDRQRNPPPELTPPARDPPSNRRVTSSSHNSRNNGHGTRRRAQEKTIRKASISSTTKNYRGDPDAVKTREIGAQIPFPDQLYSPYAKAGIGVGVDKGILAPDGQVAVGSYATVGHTFAAGPLYYTSSRTENQDHNPPPQAEPDPPARPERVPVAAPIANVIYVTSGGKRVYYDNYGDLRGENSRQRLKGTHAVYSINKKRSLSVMDSISHSMNAPSNSTGDLQGQWQLYYAIYTQLQANASALLAPVLDNLVNISNVSYVYEMAWSIQSQLVGSTCVYSGAYLNGLTSFDDFMDNWLVASGFLLDVNGTIFRPRNETISNATLLAAGNMIAINTYLQDMYYTAWDAAVKAVNVTHPGSNHTVLEDLVYYANVITATNRTDIVDPSFLTVNVAAAKEEAAWFLQGLNATSS